MNIRKPVVAGQFYPSDPRRLENEIKRVIDTDLPKKKAMGVISPHASYSCSGKVAGMVFSRVNVPERVILLGPTHTGYGAEVSIMEEGIWETPLGRVKIEEALAKKILQNSDIIESDTLAQVHEHSLEVQVPMLQYIQPNLRIVPIVLGKYDFPACESVAHAIAEGIKATEEDVLIVASSDFTHYEPHSIAEQKDKRAIEKIEQLDAKGFFSMIVRERLTVCGFLPITTMILAAKALGAQHATLVRYATSGEVTGDYSHVVGYGGIIVD